jgi:hypothetical protein
VDGAVNGAMGPFHRFLRCIQIPFTGIAKSLEKSSRAHAQT